MEKSIKKQLSNIIMPVEKIPMADLIPGIKTTSKQGFAIIVKKGDTKKLVNTCSKLYHLIPNEDIIRPLLDKFSKFDINLVGASNKNDTRFTADFTFKKGVIKIGKDEILPRIRLYNSYDGRTKYFFSMGLYRLVCSNGMVAPLEGFEELKVNFKHTPNSEFFTADEAEMLMDKVVVFLDHMGDIKKNIKELGKKVIEDPVEDIVMDIIQNTRFPKRKAEDVIEILEEEMETLQIEYADSWLMYNAFNNILNHDKDMKMDLHKREAIDSRVLTYISNL